MEAQFGKQLYMRAASHVLSKNNSDSDSFVDYAVQRIHVVLLALCALFSNLLATVVGRSRPLIQFELAVATFLGALRSRYEPDSTAKHEGACYSSDESLRNLRSTEALQSVCVMCSHSLAPFEFMDSVDLLSERLNGDHELQVLNIYSAEAYRARQRERASIAKPPAAAAVQRRRPAPEKPQATSQTPDGPNSEWSEFSTKACSLET